MVQIESLMQTISVKEKRAREALQPGDPINVICKVGLCAGRVQKVDHEKKLILISPHPKHSLDTPESIGLDSTQISCLDLFHCIDNGLSVATDELKEWIADFTQRLKQFEKVRNIKSVTKMCRMENMCLLPNPSSDETKARQSLQKNDPVIYVDTETSHRARKGRIVSRFGDKVTIYSLGWKAEKWNITLSIDSSRLICLTEKIDCMPPPDGAGSDDDEIKDISVVDFRRIRDEEWTKDYKNRVARFNVTIDEVDVDEPLLLTQQKQQQYVMGNDLRQDMQHLLTEQHFADLVLVASDGHEFLVHKPIVASRCKVLLTAIRFQGFQKQDTKDNQQPSPQDQKMRINIPYSREAIQTMVHYLYTGTTTDKKSITTTTLEQLLYLSDEYNLDHLLGLVTTDLVERINMKLIKNAITIIERFTAAHGENHLVVGSMQLVLSQLANSDSKAFVKQLLSKN